MNHIVNVDLSKEIAEKIKAKKGRSFYTNSIGVIDVESCRYVIGYALFKKTDKSFSAMEHSWIERDTELGKEIIDPSLYIDNLIYACKSYHKALEFEPDTMHKTITRNKGNPALQFYGNNYDKMEELQQKLKKDISEDIHFISCEHWRDNTKKNLTDEEVQEIYKFLDEQYEVMDKTNKLFDDLGAFEKFSVEEEIEAKSKIENDQIEGIIYDLTEEKFRLSEETAKFVCQGWLMHRFILILATR